MAVYPANDSALVNQIGEILGADLDVIMSLNNLDGKFQNCLEVEPSGAKGRCPKTPSLYVEVWLALHPVIVREDTYGQEAEPVYFPGSQESHQPPLLPDQGC